MNYILPIFFVLSSFFGTSQIPAGYYDSAAGLTGEDRRNALSNIIDDHYVIPYESLWNYFSSSDAKPGSKVWDMYSDVPGGTPSYIYTFVTDQCGQYSNEGDCYNREHSVPQDWFNGASSPMYSDLFHIYPTDGFVNGKRSNYPFGEVSSPTWTSTNGSKLGSNTYPGYSGTVFEPVDEYKGDFARTYFYTMTRYKSDVSGWNSAMFSGNNLAQWAENMLIEWSENDTVSQKEMDRNNFIYQIQGNRNPYIDHPEWVEFVWVWPTSIQEKEIPEISVRYADGTLFLDYPVGEGTALIYNVLGEKIKTIQLNKFSANYPLNLQTGIYFLNLRDSQVAATVKFLAMGL